jgi:DNA-binding NtrC family response regulator
VVGRALVRSGDARVVSAEMLTQCLREEERLQHLGADGGNAAETTADAPATLKELQARHIQSALRRSDGNITRAAKLLGLSRTTLQSKLRTMQRTARPQL